MLRKNKKVKYDFSPQNLNTKLHFVHVSNFDTIWYSNFKNE